MRSPIKYHQFAESKKLSKWLDMRQWTYKYVLFYALGAILFVMIVKENWFTDNVFRTENTDKVHAGDKETQMSSLHYAYSAILPGTACKPQTNIAFVKVHKTGSSTMLNMFYRFAARYRLNLVLPKSVEGTFNYLGYGTTLDPRKIALLPDGESYNILCNHVVYSRQAFRSVMPTNSMYIGILRNPVSNFLSAFTYYGGVKFMKENTSISMLSEMNLMNAFLQKPHKYYRSSLTYHVHNKMSFDMGLKRSDFEDTSEISNFISNLDQDFILIIILEYFDESLILLKRLLCWEFRDILYLPVNIGQSHRTHRIKMALLTNHSIGNLRKYNQADFMLYNFFKNRLLSQIKFANENFKLEVKQFRQIQLQVLIYCRKWSNENLIVPKSKWNSPFSVSRVDCLDMMRDELHLVKEKIRMANVKYSRWLKRNKKG